MDTSALELYECRRPPHITHRCAYHAGCHGQSNKHYPTSSKDNGASRNDWGSFVAGRQFCGTVGEIPIGKQGIAVVSTNKPMRVLCTGPSPTEATHVGGYWLTLQKGHCNINPGTCNVYGEHWTLTAAHEHMSLPQRNCRGASSPPSDLSWRVTW